MLLIILLSVLVDKVGTTISYYIYILASDLCMLLGYPGFLVIGSMTSKYFYMALALDISDKTIVGVT
jgi:hypothetical protein